MEKEGRKAKCRVIAIGSSTGGPGVIEEILKDLPKSSPAIIIVQHMKAAKIKATEISKGIQKEVRSGSNTYAGKA